MLEKSKSSNVTMPNELRDKIIGSVAAKKVAEKKQNVSKKAIE